MCLFSQTALVAEEVEQTYQELVASGENSLFSYIWTKSEEGLECEIKVAAGSFFCPKYKVVVPHEMGREPRLNETECSFIPIKKITGLSLDRLQVVVANPSTEEDQSIYI